MKTRRHRRQRGGVGFPSWFNGLFTRSKTLSQPAETPSGKAWFTTKSSLVTDECKPKMFGKNNPSEKCNLQRTFDSFLKKNKIPPNVKLTQAIQSANTETDLLNNILRSEAEGKIGIVKGFFGDYLNNLFKSMSYPYNSDMAPRQKIIFLQELFETDLFDFFSNQDFSVEQKVDKLKQIFNAKNLCEILDNKEDPLNENERTQIISLFPTFYVSNKSSPKPNPSIEDVANTLMMVKIQIEVINFMLFQVEFESFCFMNNISHKLTENYKQWLTSLFIVNKDVNVNDCIKILHRMIDLIQHMLYEKSDPIYEDHKKLIQTIIEANIMNEVKITNDFKAYLISQDKKSFLKSILPEIPIPIPFLNLEKNIIEMFPEFALFNEFVLILKENNKILHQFNSIKIINLLITEFLNNKAQSDVIKEKGKPKQLEGIQQTVVTAINYKLSSDIRANAKAEAVAKAKAEAALQQQSKK